jgi:hypothetical protein
MHVKTISTVVMTMAAGIFAQTDTDPVTGVSNPFEYIITIHMLTSTDSWKCNGR